MRVVVGADHRGYEMKDFIAAYARSLGHDVIDVGTHDSNSVDYPDLAVALAEKIQSGEAERGVLVCGSGVGACIAANKLTGIRAGLAHDTYSAHQGVEHDDMNVICLGSRVIGEEVAVEVVKAFLGARFIPEERYLRRLEKVRALESRPAPTEVPN